jgi:circadian clock protein KaiC
MAQEAREREAENERLELTEQRKRQIARKRDALERQIAEMRATLDAEEDEVSKLLAHQNIRRASAVSDRAAMAKKRGGNR